VRAFFPGGGAGSLASAFSGSVENLPGVAPLVSTALAVGIVCAYLAVAVGVSLLSMQARDAA
jgi:hypothetical protein